jgi:HSP20 family protein
MANESQSKNVETARRTGGEVSRRGESLPGFWTDPGEFFRLGPFGMMRRMQEEMDRMMSGFGFGGGQRGWSPALEVRERDNQLIVCAELPGLEKDDVNVEVTDNSVVIRGERRREQTDEREGAYRSERSYGAFYRSVPLPEYAKGDQATANFRNGVLEISVPLEQQAKSRSRSIPIETGAPERKSAATETKAAEERRKSG